MIETLAEQFKAGGVFMWPILGAFAVGFAVVVERLIYYYLINRKSAELVNTTFAALKSRDAELAKQTVLARNTPLFRLFQAAVDRFVSGADMVKVQRGIEETAIEELPKMSQRLNYLSLLANIATLLGLLGTIAGMQELFSSLASVDASQKAAMLASGISKAMVTTASGLIVAIPCMIMYTALNNKKQSLVKDIDSSVVKLVNFMKEQAA